VFLITKKNHYLIVSIYWFYKRLAQTPHPLLHPLCTYNKCKIQIKWKYRKEEWKGKGQDNRREKEVMEDEREKGKGKGKGREGRRKREKGKDTCQLPPNYKYF
jgi:hypothetical protein